MEYSYIEAGMFVVANIIGILLTIRVGVALLIEDYINIKVDEKIQQAKKANMVEKESEC